MPLRIEGPLLGQSAVCESILRALPQWFGIEEALVQYVRDVETLPTFVAIDCEFEGRAIGFMSVRRHFPHAAELHVLGVRPEAHRHGIGRALIERIEAWLIEDGVRYLQVKTLGTSRPNAEYECTRKFYEAMGFYPLEEMKTLWGERNPCLVMVKGLGA